MVPLWLFGVYPLPRTVLHLSIDKVLLVRALRTATVDEEGGGFAIFGRGRAVVSRHSGELRVLGDRVANDRHLGRTGNDNGVAKVFAVKDIVAHLGAVHRRFRVVAPGRGAKDDADLEVAAKCMEAVVVDLDSGVVARPWVVVDEVDTWVVSLQ